MDKSNSREKVVVLFHREQLKYLESIFPQQVLNPDKSEAAMRHYFGTQAVIEHIRTRTK